MMTYKFIKIFDYISKVKNGKSYINLKSNSSELHFSKSLQKLNNLEINDKYILLNIDAPFHIMIFYKIFRRKIILRIDGLYSDL